MLVQYHDREWGVPSYERNISRFSSSQAHRPDELVARAEKARRVSARVRPNSIRRKSRTTPRDKSRSLHLIRHHSQPHEDRSAVRNARAFLKSRKIGDFDSYCWRFVGGRPSLTVEGYAADSSDFAESAAFSKDLKHRDSASSAQRSFMPTCKRLEW